MKPGAYRALDARGRLLGVVVVFEVGFATRWRWAGERASEAGVPEGVRLEPARWPAVEVA